MRIYIITAVFPPEPLTSAYTSADIALELTNRGHEVTVFAPFPNKPKGEVLNGFRRKWCYQRVENGYKVIHCWHSLSRHSRLFSRFLENVTFGLSSTLQLFHQEKPDVVYMNTWPIIAQSINSFWLSKNKVSLICAVQDIYPESLIDKDMLNPRGMLAKWLWKLDEIHLNRCKKIITLSPGMAHLVQETRNISKDKIEVFPNWVAADNFPYFNSTSGEFRSEHKIPDDAFIALLAGSLTLSANVMIFIKVAEILKNRKNIRILLVGDGSLRPDLEHEIKKRGLTNICIIYPLFPKDVPLVQAAADVLLLSLKGTMSHSAAPSKQVSYLFSGRPIVASLPAEGFPAEIIRKADCGLVLPPDDPEKIAETLVNLSENRDGLTQMGLNARKYGEANFSKNIILKKLVDTIETIGKKYLRI